MIYDQLGVARAINCLGVYTDTGGATISRAVWEQMGEANRWSVEMPALIRASGARAAELIGAEAGWITPGASAAIALMTAAAIVGDDGAASERLPDTGDLPNQVVVQAPQRPTYKYLRMVWMAGAEIVEAGDGDGVTADQLREALGREGVAALFIPAHLDGAGGSVPLADAAELARAAGVPCLVDAAYLNYPPDSMRRFTDAGADLVCFSSKYMYGPNVGGVVVGRPDLVNALPVSDFTRFETSDYWAFGRPFKLDRHSVVGAIAALEEWFARDHEARWRGYAEVVERIAAAIDGLAGVSSEAGFLTMSEELENEPINCLVVTLDAGAVGRSSDAVVEGLANGNPSVLVHPAGERMIIAVDALEPEDVDAVITALRRELGG